MKYLKLYESFSVGEYKYILITDDEQYYVKTNSAYKVFLMKVDNLNLSLVNNLRLSKAISLDVDDITAIKDRLLQGLDWGDSISIKFEEGFIFQTEYTEENLKKMPLLRRNVKTTEEKFKKGLGNKRFSTEKVREIINGLKPIRIFMGVYSDEDWETPKQEESDYLNI